MTNSSTHSTIRHCLLAVTLGLLGQAILLPPMALANASTPGYQYANPYALFQAETPNMIDGNDTGYVSLPVVAETEYENRTSPSTSSNDVPVLMAAIQSPSEAYGNHDASQSPTFDMRTPTPINLTKGRSKIIKFAQPLQRVSIADPNLADIIPLEPEQIMINGLQRGVTSLIVWDEFGREGIFDLNINNDTSELTQAIESIAPNENIQLRVTDDSFVISGQVSNSVILDEIRRLAGAYGYRDESFVDLTETPIPQVVLNVKIVEMSRTLARDIKTSFTGDAGNTFSVTRLGSAIDSGLEARQIASRLSSLARLNGGERTDSGLIPWRPIAQTQTANNIGGLTGSLLGFGESPIGIAFDMLENTGKLSILAEPKLVSTHGRSASFLAGGEFPFVSGINFNGSPILEFKEYGVMLNFTPWVNVRSGMIELSIAPEVSSIDNTNCTNTGVGQVCGLIKRSTDTTVQLNDGESLMISGILSKREQESFAKVPFIADIPIIGNLFKNPSKSKTDTELIVIVQPRILETTAATSIGHGMPSPRQVSYRP